MIAEKETALEFTTDWFSNHIPLWTWLLKLAGPCRKYLEIGSFEGRSACWMLQHAMTPDGSVYCIDTWEGSPEIVERVSVKDSFELFKRNVNAIKKPDQEIKIYRRKSVDALANLLMMGNESSFDLIYIDGSHAGADVLTDACMAWPLLRKGGVMIFDDYLFQINQPGMDHCPKFAIDAFTAVFKSKMQFVASGDQHVIQKL